MAVTGSQYNSIMREYRRIRSEEEQDLRDRTAEVYERIPEMRELDARVGSSALRRYKSFMAGGDSGQIDGFAGELEEISGERARLLREAGYPADYLQMRYRCSICRDTGIADGKHCSCYMEKVRRLLFAQSSLKDSGESWDSMSWDIYDDSRVIPELSMTQLEYMKKVAGFCRHYCEKFDDEGGSILFMGPTGVGKTYLSRCIASSLLDSCHSVIMLTAIELFDVMGRVRIEKTDDDAMKTVYDSLFTCDLLILDDLGSELPNSMTVSELFYVIDHRLGNNRSTVISTNLDLKSMRDIYSERITSRLQRNYTDITLYGEDLRLKS